LEGVFLSALVPLLRDLLTGEECCGVGVPVKGGIGLEFEKGILVLCGRPDSPGIWWQKDHVEMSRPSSPAWEQHLTGSTVENVCQQGADRVLEIEFASRKLYGGSSTRLVFEATGRNSNIILVRRDDDRILACLRKVGSNESRYRTIAPGQRYVPPPSSGLRPGHWTDSADLTKALENDPVPSILYRRLEGVGPATAGAILKEADSRGVPVMEIVAELESALLGEDFRPWSGVDGKLPVSIGPGEPIGDPLAQENDDRPRNIRKDRLETWCGIVNGRLRKLRLRLSKVEKALEDLVSPEELRIWGGLLLSRSDISRKGMSSITLKDWEGVDRVIPLKRSRSLKDNAERFFRKATNAVRERRSLEERRTGTVAEIDKLEKLLKKTAELSVEELDRLLKEYDSPETGSKGREGRNIPMKVLGDGWRCFIGRNARENEEVTFRLGKRNDLWFHARGLPGAHVLLKLDGRDQNPPGRIMMEAAAEAARRSGVRSGVVPVDYTRVQYVNRMKKGKPGQVVYSREKTIFIDLDSI
jgi:predicted ribosome quality control (RQC) complex YloA/Tae2 family protein